MADPALASASAGALADLSTRVDAFNKQLQPMTETLEAIDTLRKAGTAAIIDILDEIKAERDAEQKIATHEKVVGELKDRFNALQQETDALKSNKKNRKFLGLGGLKDGPAKEFAEKSRKLEAISAAAETAASELEKMKDPANLPPSQYGQFAREKQKLRELLDLPEEDHKKRQQDLVAAAQDFVGHANLLVAAAEEKRRVEEETAALRIREEADWRKQGCPTNEPVVKMRPLTFRGNS